jgi:hypothetical protein
VERLLNRETLKANVREDNERALASLKHQLKIAAKSAKEQKMEKRYHMVRFVGIVVYWTFLTRRAAKSYPAITASREIVQRECHNRSDGRYR